MIRAFLFDLDGVLTDTSEFHYQAWQQLATEIGVPFDRADNEALRGVSRRESLLLLLKGRPASEEQMDEWMERKNNNYLALVSQMTPADLLPGAAFLELRRDILRFAVSRQNHGKEPLTAPPADVREVTERRTSFDE